jgi:hypothetical protein
VGGEGQWQKQKQNEEESTHCEPPISGSTSRLSLLPA